jgi:23S rRNA (pseudouridine1915-N3)-methyltransferase
VRLLLVSVGRAKSGAERDLVDRYMSRAAATGRGIGFSFIEIREIDESRARRPEDRKLEEAKAIRAAMGAAQFIACDETGKNLSSVDFAAALAQPRDAGVASLALMIGGPDGLDPDLRAEARLVLAFGAMTWPHQLARVLAAEQIYRAITILSGHPYHRI